MSDKVEYYMIRNWARYQHYKNRNPVWVKLHTSILDDYNFTRLTPMARLTFLLLAPLAARVSNKIPYSRVWVAEKLSLRQDMVKLDELIENNYLVPYIASKSLASCYQDASTEKRQRQRQRSETEKKPSTPLVSDPDFDSFWSAYPRKKNKGAAKRAWKKIKPNGGLVAVILNAIAVQKRSHDWRKENGDFIPYPASWLNAEGWLNEETNLPNDGIPQGRPGNNAGLRRILEREGEL